MALAFVESSGVNVTVQAWADGWTALATHDALETSKSCAIYFGEAPVVLEELVGAEPGQIVCAPF